MTTYLDLKQAHALITGGSEGIGRGLAARYLAAGSTVLITGRSPEKLARAAQELPGLRTFANDIGTAAGREALANHVESTMAEINVLIDNAGFQRRVSLAADSASWPERQAEIDTLLAAPVHLNHLLIPKMLRHGGPALLVNVTSGGAFVPQVFAPIYSACKAALHSYTVTLRHALQQTPIRVVELIPPAVRTSLAGPGATHGAPLDDFCDAAFSRLQRADAEFVGFGPTDTSEFKGMIETGRPLFSSMSERFPVAVY